MLKAMPSTRPFLQGMVMVILLWAGCHSARADLKCANENIISVLDIGINTPEIVVTPGIPLGTVIYHHKTSITARCSLTKVSGSTENAYFKRLNVSKILGNGLSLYITYKGDRGNTAKSIDTKIEVTNRNAFWGLPSSSWQEIPLDIEFEIVKEQQAGDTVVAAPSSTIIFNIDSQMQGTAAPFFIKGANKIGFKPQTCEISGPASFTVAMNTVSPSDKDGFGAHEGSTGPQKNFSLSMICDVAISGAFKVMMKLDSTTVSGLETQGVIALSPGTTAAEGVGIQILHGDSQTPVSFTTPWQIGDYPRSDAKLIVPFSARYYQTDKIIRPGQANGTMTYTISYM